MLFFFFFNSLRTVSQWHNAEWQATSRKRTQKTSDASLCSATLLLGDLRPATSLLVFQCLQLWKGDIDSYQLWKELWSSYKDKECYIRGRNDRKMSFQPEPIRSGFCKGKTLSKVNKGKNVLFFPLVELWEILMLGIISYFLFILVLLRWNNITMVSLWLWLSRKGDSGP